MSLSLSSWKAEGEEMTRLRNSLNRACRSINKITSFSSFSSIKRRFSFCEVMGAPLEADAVMTELSESSTELDR